MKISFYRKTVSDPESLLPYRWFVSWLNWLIPEKNREMVCGTEDMLERLSSGAPTFTIRTDTNNPKIVLRLIKKRNLGGWYSVEVLDEYTSENVTLPRQIWTCNVTRFVFGRMPKEIRITWD